MGLCVFSLPTPLVMIERIYTLSYYHHQIRSMNYYPLFNIIGHETMVCAVCLSIFLRNWKSMMIHLIYMTTECKNGKVSYFRFDDDSLTTYKYVISIIKIGISQKKNGPLFYKASDREIRFHPYFVVLEWGHLSPEWRPPCLPMFERVHGRILWSGAGWLQQWPVWKWQHVSPSCTRLLVWMFGRLPWGQMWDWGIVIVVFDINHEM